MTKIKCKNCDKTWNYTGKNKVHATCPDCRRNVKLTLLPIAIILLIGGMGIAYAEEVNLPIDDVYDDKFCVFLGVTDYVQFTCNWKWFLPDYVMTEINVTEVPARISDVPEHNLQLADLIRLILERGEPIVETPSDTSIIEDDVTDEPLTKEEREIESAILTLAECRTGLGAWAAYQEQAPIEHYTDQSRWEFSIRDNLSQSPIIGKMLKAIEECRIMQRYADDHLIGAYELNKVLADLAGVDYLGRPSNPEVRSTDQSDASVLTDPVTEKDKADELKEMEELRDRLIEERVFEDPYAEFTGINRGGQPAGLKCQTAGQPHDIYGSPAQVCPLDSYNAHIARNPDVTPEDIQQLLCTHYLTMYIHKVGTDEFPAWLNHCVPKVVRE